MAPFTNIDQLWSRFSSKEAVKDNSTSSVFIYVSKYFKQFYSCKHQWNQVIDNGRGKTWNLLSKYYVAQGLISSFYEYYNNTEQ